MEDVICETKPEHDINCKTNSGRASPAWVIGIFLLADVNNLLSFWTKS